jgi:hypothetical protein
MVPVLVSRHPFRSTLALAVIIALAVWAGVDVAATCVERDPLTTTHGIDALITAHLARGASVDDIHQFLRENDLGDSDVSEVGDSTFSREEGIDSSTLVISAFGPSDGGSIVSCQPQAYFILDGSKRLDRWIVRDVCTGP